MKAMIFAAGLGTRLHPITQRKPKALVEVHGRPLLEHVLTRLIEADFTEIIINLHHFPEQIKAFLESKNHFGIHIEFSEETDLLDTGGGLKHASAFFDDAPFLLHNVDILSDIDLQHMLQTHRQNRALATLAVKKRVTSRYLVFDEDNLLCGWKSLKENKEIKARQAKGKTDDLAFCGIHVLSPDILAKLNGSGRFSIIDSYLKLAAKQEIIQAYPADGFAWRDVGKLTELSQ